MKNILKFLIPVGLLAFLAWNVARDWNEVLGYWQNFRAFPFIVSFLFLLSIYPEGAFAWHNLLKKMGIHRNFRKTLFVWIVSNTSRYIPGKIWQYIGRIELAQREVGIARSATLLSVLAEIFFSVTAAVLVSLATLPFWGFIRGGSALWVFLIPLPLLLLHPNISSRAINLIARITKRKISQFNLQLGINESLLVIPWFILNFVLNGVALVFLTASLGLSVDISKILIFSGFYAFSWVVGYITLFAPGGVGVTEASLAYLLSYSMPFSLAAVIVLSYRFFLSIGEFLVFLVVLKIKR